MSWWENAVGYEVYLRSFADGNDDGIGDFAGLTSRLGYLADLGIDIVWVTPFYPSPLADFGYDVSDHRAIDPIYGSMEDFDRFVAAAHDHGLRVVIDVVPNHSSSEHAFFRSALEDGPGSEHWDFYVWRDPAPDGGPPNNWLSFFGGSAWTLVPKWDKYYMHLFLPEQPDLNWANPRVRDDFVAILQFWKARGVDGFRIDVAHSLVEDAEYRDNPVEESKTGTVAVGDDFDAFDHIYDYDQAGVVDIFRRWKRQLGPETLLLGEVYITEPDKIVRYISEGRLDRSFFFGLNRIKWDPVEFAALIREACDAMTHGWSWVQGSHDESRAVTRFGGGAEGWERAMALWVAMMGLPGTPFLYQGEELGLEDGEVAPEDMVDPVGVDNPEKGRDPCRTPMPWTATQHNGFSSTEPWLRCAPRSEEETVEAQLADPHSRLSKMRELIRVRGETTDRRAGALRWIDSPQGTLAFARDGVAHVANLTDEDVMVSVGEGWDQLFSTGGPVLRIGADVRLASRSGIILGRSTTN
ncbi:MAG TPA: alpha-amylase family glycosyl hydrolase [Acidimicrobiia bacterium]